jgi:hypothetical protein
MLYKILVSFLVFIFLFAIILFINYFTGSSLRYKVWLSTFLISLIFGIFCYFTIPDNLISK